MQVLASVDMVGGRISYNEEIDVMDPKRGGYGVSYLLVVLVWPDKEEEGNPYKVLYDLLYLHSRLGDGVNSVYYVGR